ncbi:MAG: glycosyltransferase [Proteobacteria bacterium]|nr:glycosyltransferase [Pseudomonadota bacterium]
MKTAPSVEPPLPAAALVSVVVIGRNEGKRLTACLKSIHAMNADLFATEIIYVDSDSSDGSPQAAASMGARVIRVKPERPSAALGRNAGWRAARGQYILFLDGDTLLHPEFVRRALAQFRDPEAAIVWGHRRELAPAQSIYVRVLDLDWVYPAGDSEFCGGDALVRRDVLERVDGFDQSLIAGEEPEMCRRIRAHGYRIVHIDAPMTRHDLAVNTFRAYWRRAFRAGHAYAEIASRFRAGPDPLWQAEARRNLIHGGLLLSAPFLLLLGAVILRPAALLLACALLSGLGLSLLARSARRCAWKSDDAITRWFYAAHSHLQQVPILFGQLAQRLDARNGRQRRLIEYKPSSGSL